MKENLNKYIGKIHEYQGTGDTCDCLNLVQQFYKDHGYEQDFDDGRPRPATYDEYIKHEPTRLIRYLLKHFAVTEKPDELEYGDVILVLVDGDPHVGVYVGEGKALAMEIPVIYGKSKSTIYRARYWKPFFRAGFKRRK